MWVRDCASPRGLARGQPFPYSRGSETVAGSRPSTLPGGVWVGVYRFCLALIVAAFHLSAAGEHVAMVAVFSFYAISGYLITRILCETYTAPVQGLIGFAVNRFLRLYPTYWAVALVGLGLALFLPVETARLHPGIAVPQTIGGGLANTVILGLANLAIEPRNEPIRLVPPAWSLSIELVYYALLAAGVARRRLAVLVWWGISLGLAVWLVGRGDLRHAYFALWGPSLCFATGALAHHLDAPGWGRRLRALCHPGGAVAASALGVLPFALLAAVCVAPYALGGGDGAGLPFLYLAPFVAAVAVATLIEDRGDGATERPFARWDRWIGDLSYPIFLSHWHVGILVSALLLGGAGQGPWLFAASLPFILLAGVLLVVGVEHPVRRLRGAVRRWGRGPAPTPAAARSDGGQEGRRVEDGGAGAVVRVGVRR